MRVGTNWIRRITSTNKEIKKILKGAVVVWLLVISCCFREGYWINEQPWDDRDPWKN